MEGVNKINKGVAKIQFPLIVYRKVDIVIFANKSKAYFVDQSFEELYLLGIFLIITVVRLSFPIIMSSILILLEISSFLLLAINLGSERKGIVG